MKNYNISKKGRISMNQIRIGKFIAEMRKQQNLTQREFANALGISDKTVSKWERGNGMPELSFMQPICKILKIELNELFSVKSWLMLTTKRKPWKTCLHL